MAEKPALGKLVKALQNEPKARKLRQTLIDKKGYNSEIAETFKDVVTRILAVADVVCCTTHASTKDILGLWACRTAKTTFLDEAGAISLPEALVPWFNGHPLVIAGNIRQLPPYVMTSNEKASMGGPLKYFKKHQEMSALERLMRMQWPCWVSRW
ncbi:DNA helicase [Ilyonectria robusta]